MGMKYIDQKLIRNTLSIASAYSSKFENHTVHKEFDQQKMCTNRNFKQNTGWLDANDNSKYCVYAKIVQN